MSSAIDRDRLALHATRPWRQPSASHAAFRAPIDEGLSATWPLEMLRREREDSRASDVRDLFKRAPVVELGEDFDAIRATAIRRDELAGADERARRDALERKRIRDELRAGPQWAEQLSRAQIMLICTLVALAAFSGGYMFAPSYSEAVETMRAAQIEKCDARIALLPKPQRPRLRDELRDPTRGN